MSGNPSTVPVLQPPGAGLPPVELRIARLLFRLAGWRATRESSLRLLSQQTDAMVALVEPVDDELARRPILIKRLPGMEDSSRYWSLFMTVEHVKIVNLTVAKILRDLNEGKVPARAANTALVKPSPEAGRDALSGLLTSRKLIERQARQAPTLDAPLTYTHPWFGPLKAGQWLFVAGFHSKLHVKQIRMILHGLKSGRH